MEGAREPKTHSDLDNVIDFIKRNGILVSGLPSSGLYFLICPCFSRLGFASPCWLDLSILRIKGKRSAIRLEERKGIYRRASEETTEKRP